MSSKNSALASLTAQYTDSENEDDNKSDEELDSDSSESVILPPQQETPTVQFSDHSLTPPPRHKALRLVSYIDDTIVTDDENVSPNREITNMDISEDEEEGTPKQPQKKIDRAAIYGFTLPPEPKGKCPPELQEKISNLYEKMKTSNMDTNKIIQERKEFRNPSIYEKLIQFCDINELGTNYPPEIYDPAQWGKESYYEELAKSQKVEMERIEKSRRETTKTELAAAAAKRAEEDAKKRKSKWDQPGVQANTNLKPAAVVQPALTTTATGTKGTVISAFGSLPKKPKA